MYPCWVNKIKALSKFVVMKNQKNNLHNPATDLSTSAPADSRYSEGFIKRQVNRLLAGILWLVSLLPLRVLYLFSDFLYLLVRYVFRYRHKVIEENLSYAFPEKSEKEKKRIAGKFYRHFTDLMMESVKLHSIGANQMKQRLLMEGFDLVDKYYSQGKSVIVLAMHHNNWEWGSFVQTTIKQRGLYIYNPVRGNRAMEKFILHSREKWGGKCIPVHQSARVTLGFHNKNIPTLLWLGADQTPPAGSKFWTIFLNREAPFFSGPEKIAARTNQPVFFQHMSKLSRGHYLLKLVPLVENPASLEPKEILLAYVKKMEEVIRNEPEYYLWSHRRWKHSRPEGIALTFSSAD